MDLEIKYVGVIIGLVLSLAIPLYLFEMNDQLWHYPNYVNLEGVGYKYGLFSVNSSKIVVIQYSNSTVDKMKISPYRIYRLAKVYGFTPVLYDIDNPWVYVKTPDGKIPLVFPTFVPSVMCINGNKTMFIYGERYIDTENVIYLLDKCSKLK